MILPAGHIGLRDLWGEAVGSRGKAAELLAAEFGSHYHKALHYAADDLLWTALVTWIGSDLVASKGGGNCKSVENGVLTPRTLTLANMVDKGIKPEGLRVTDNIDDMWVIRKADFQKPDNFLSWTSYIDQHAQVICREVLAPTFKGADVWDEPGFSQPPLFVSLKFGMLKFDFAQNALQARPRLASCNANLVSETVESLGGAEGYVLSIPRSKFDRDWGQFWENPPTAMDDSIAGSSRGGRPGLSGYWVESFLKEFPDGRPVNTPWETIIRHLEQKAGRRLDVAKNTFIDAANKAAKQALNLSSSTD